MTLVYDIAYWTELLNQDFPEDMEILHKRVAETNDVPVAYHNPKEKSRWWVPYRTQSIDLTFTVLVIRGKLLKEGRSMVSNSLDTIDIGLLGTMEDLLETFPISFDRPERVQQLLDQLHVMSV